MLQGSTRRSHRTPPGRSTSPREVPTLSERQRQVLELLAEGVHAREIATELGLAEATVRNHIRAVLRKLGCHSQLEAVAVAFRLELLHRDPVRPRAG